MNIRILALAVALGFATALSSIFAQNPAPSAADEAKEREAFLKKLGAQTSGVGKIGNHAELAVPEGFIFFPTKGAQTMLKQMGNLISGDEEGLIIHEKDGWLVAFEFSDDGYVKDDEKDKLDAAKILKQMQDSEEGGNEARKEAGLPAQHTVGFAIPPHYNEQTQNLEWAIRFTTEGQPGETINHRTKVLGRRGVMDVTLACGPDELNAVLPDFRRLMEKYRYVEGETYAEYRQGDKLATYGLIGAVAGGAALMAGKAGLFSKLGVLIAKGGKAVIVGVIALFAGIAKLFGKIFGRRES